jgi:hypothetical protein
MKHTEDIDSADYRPFQFGARFSAKARGPSMKSSLLSIA